MKKFRYFFTFLSLCLLLLPALLLVPSGCRKTDHYNPIPLTGYYAPLQAGKYVTYRMDSLNFHYYGQLDTTTSYLAKDSVEEAIVDNIGRLSWRVVRYLTDTAAAGPWVSSETYMVTPAVSTLEVVENNLRFIKLAFPMNEGYNWHGNSYLPYAPFKDFFDYSDDSHLSLGLWNYSYQNVNKPYQAGTITYDSTLTVSQADNSINVPITDPNAFASRTYWVEVYARHIGLVKRVTKLWEYQPPTPNGSRGGYKVGFELSMTLIDHN